MEIPHFQKLDKLEDANADISKLNVAQGVYNMFENYVLRLLHNSTLK